MFDFTNQVVMITGAVGNLGMTLAQAVQQAGGKTVLVDHSAGRLSQVYAHLVDSADHFLAAGIDLAHEASARHLIESVQQRFGRLDVLLNTVGGFRGGPAVHEGTLEMWDWLWTVNLRTALIVSRAVVPMFIRQGSGRIVHVSARGGLTGTSGLAAYSATKSALIRLTESLAAELKEHGITANCVLPGTLDTPQNRAAMPEADHSKSVPVHDVANVMLFLASDAARAVTGAAIPVYGRS